MNEDDQTDKWTDREEAHARQVISTAKLLVALGITIRVVLLPSRPEEGRLDKDAFKDPKQRVIAADKAVALADRAHNLVKKQIWFAALASFVAGLGLLLTDRR